MRFLIACPGCRRQFDVAGRPLRERFRCSCGATLEVPLPQDHAAAVVRCSSCGAPRLASAAACRFCGGDFTLHDQDLDTICAGCMARVSGRARFCHSCSSPVLVRQASAALSDLSCPTCGGGRSLASRQLGRMDVAFFECDACAGMWLEREVFEVLLERARSEAQPELELRPRAEVAAGLPPKGPFYRPCVACGKPMNRRNWADRSGIILDVCRQHGVWFDAHELAALLRFVRTGGERQQTTPTLEAERAALRQLALQGSLRTGRLDAGGSLGGSLATRALGFLGGVIESLFEP